MIIKKEKKEKLLVQTMFIQKPYRGFSTCDFRNAPLIGDSNREAPTVNSVPMMMLNPLLGQINHRNAGKRKIVHMSILQSLEECVRPSVSPSVRNTFARRAETRWRAANVVKRTYLIAHIMYHKCGSQYVPCAYEIQIHNSTTFIYKVKRDFHSN